MKKRKQIVYVGISGGVDSSVAAHLLKKEGYDVHGVFIKTWAPDWLPCTWVSEKRDAMRVCAALDIPFHFLDAEEAYRRGVAEYMIAEYRAGRTPNPDVLCNRVVKFGVLWEYAKARGAAYIATGHYVQKHDGLLHSAQDAAKDQSYFLWMLTKDDLAHSLFPIGAYQKDQVRTIAASIGLPTAHKKDSQGICFLGTVDMRSFLSRYITESPGVVVNTLGVPIGTHDGVLFYTLGERHGFRITDSESAKTPQYVVAKQLETNTLVVSPERIPPQPKGYSVLLTLRDINWVTPPDHRRRYQAQLRYHGATYPVRVKGETQVVLLGNDVVALGQSLVVYDGPLLIGGGVIDEVSVVV